MSPVAFGALVSAALLAASLPAIAADAAPRQAPKLEAGDSWTYGSSREVRGIRRTTHSTTSIVRVEGQSIGVETHVAGTGAPGREVLVGADWTTTRSIDGKQVVVSHPLAFPLAPGRTWKLSFTEDAPRDRRHSREQLALTYRVVGWETVTVPAGTFRALRIVADGVWRVELASNMPPVASLTFEGGEIPVTLQPPGKPYTGRLLRTYWYAPELRRWVRYEEDTYDSNNLRAQQRTSILEAYSVGGRSRAAPGADASPVGADAAPAAEAPSK